MCGAFESLYGIACSRQNQADMMLRMRPPVLNRMPAVEGMQRYVSTANKAAVSFNESSFPKQKHYVLRRVRHALAVALIMSKCAQHGQRQSPVGFRPSGLAYAGSPIYYSDSNPDSTKYSLTLGFENPVRMEKPLQEAVVLYPSCKDVSKIKTVITIQSHDDHNYTPKRTAWYAASL
jgi:hypothetical protein